MAEKIRARLFIVAPLVVSSALLAGCMSSPTYGTGKTSNEQLFDDVTGMLSMAPKNGGERIDYKPRGELVRPAKGANALPSPQDSAIASASGSAWPESPEQRRKRLRDEATANQSNPFYDSPIVADSVADSSARRDPITGGSARGTSAPNFETQALSPKQQREAFKRRLAEQQQGSPQTRRFLSEPPLVYREAAATAPVGDPGEDEWKKERRIKRQGRSGLMDWLPF